MGRRLVRAAVAVVLLVAFVADLRVVAPVVAVVLVVAAWRNVLPRAEALVGAGVLAGAALAFESGDEVAAWGLALAVAVLAGLAAAIATGRRAPARRAAGSSSRAR